MTQAGNARKRRGLLPQRLPPLLNGFMGGGGAIVEGPEPLVPRNFEASVITFKIAMMHLVMKRSKREAIFVANQKALKPCMCRDGG